MIRIEISRSHDGVSIDPARGDYVKVWRLFESKHERLAKRARRKRERRMLKNKLEML